MRYASTALLLACLFPTTGFGEGASPLRPGDRIGGMVLVKGTASVANHKLFDSCDPVILKIGRSQRGCGTVPRVSSLFIGYGWFAPPKQIDKEWAMSTWTGWLDGRRIELSAFGTSDRTLYAFPAAAGKDVTLREWKVMLRHATPGRHTVRYRIQERHGVTDATWAFTVAAR